MGLGDSLGIKGLNKLIKKMEKLPDSYNDPEMFAQIGVLLKANILKRTAEGVDVDNRPFAPYSKSYKKIRAAKDLPLRPDLFFRGDMLSSLQYESSGNQTRLYFMSTSDKNGVSNAAKAYYNNRIRKFFGYNSSDVNEVLKLVAYRIKNKLGE